eukprot:664009-Pelagomonas_calceolata.AAC.6
MSHYGTVMEWMPSRCLHVQRLVGWGGGVDAIQVHQCLTSQWPSPELRLRPVQGIGVQDPDI